MKMHRSRRLEVGASLATLAVVGVFLPSGAVAAEGDPTVVNTETVSVYTDANGDVQTRRVYEQLTVTGNGTVAFDNPIEERGLRNLDGFGGFQVSDGVQHVETVVDGVSRMRTVSDYDGDLPLVVDIEYVLDGEKVSPGDVVGEEGDLEVSYTVRNVTAEPQEISFPDGKGGTITETVDVPVPMVGSLTTTLPSSFTQVRSGQANMAGDGRGGTKLSFTMTLVPPIGSDTATFGYTATVKDGVVPRATLSALPVNPLESPTFATAASSYQGGAETGETLTAGATEIDGHLLEIRDGAAKLLNGLVLLRNGSQQLEEGLVGRAAPGAQRLADGTGELRDGLTQLDDGAGRLADGAGRLDDGANQLSDGAGRLDAGAGQLADGAGRLDAGAGQLADGASRLAAGTGSALTGGQQLYAGLTQISDGLDVLAGQEGLPKAVDGVEQLQAGVDRILVGFGDIATDGSLINGLHRLELGAGQLEGGLLQLVGDGTEGNPGLVRAKGGVDQVQAGLAAAVAPGGSLDELIGGLTLLKGTDCGPICAGIIDDKLLPGVQQSKTSLSQANGGLLLVSGGLAKAIGALNTQLVPGAGALETGAATAKAGAVQLRDGVAEVDGGLGQLETGLTAAVAGVLQLANGADAAESGSASLADGLALINGGAGELADGAGRLSVGSSDLSEGADRLSAGTGELSAGAGRLADGTDELSWGALRLATGAGDAREGAGLIADGAGELASGLQEAAEGSTRLKDGLTEAAQAAPALPDGANRLSEEGMSKLVAAGEGTAQQYGKLYAIVEAGSERAQTESMALGAPADAIGLTAYSFEIQGEDGEGGRNVTRGLGALLAGGLGLGAFALRRRLV